MEIIGVGLTIIVIIQAGIFFSVRAVNSKVDKLDTKVDAKTSETTCDERREHLKRDIDHINIRLKNHCHNGGGTAKFLEV